MAYGDNQSLGIPGLLAGAALTTKQYYFVKLASTAGEVVTCDATTDVAIGVLQNNPADGEPAEVRALGVTKVVCSSTAVTAGSLIGWNAEGQAENRTQTGSRFAGVALAASSTDGDITSILLTGVSRGA